jgi:hypothetical protein
MIASGTRLGAYRVDTLVGEGGMGQVYRGVDTRLDRAVAIKVLPARLSSNAQLRERFDREARAISSLSHPHICTLFDVGSENGTDYLVMEFVEGETLADRLARGPLPLDQVIRYGSEIAMALASAHGQGVVHRDLKPGNVMLTKSGAKLLDFGLAKTATIAATAPDAPTAQQGPLTTEGMLLGTFQYMAPEQVEGGAIDARTDIFALGALLYEMVTGKRAFDGKSKASVIASILDREPPPIASFDRTAPAALDRLIRACLAKNPDDRVQAARDVAMQLRWVEQAASEAAQPAAGRKLWPAIAAAALVALVTAGFFVARRDVAKPAAFHLTVLPPEGFEFGLGSVSVSPGGDIAFAAQKGSERFLFVRGLNDPRIRQVAPLMANGTPFWSPDGKWIAYFSNQKLMKVPAAGGTPEEVTDSSYGLGGVWTDDDRIIFTPGFYQPLHVVPASGGRAKQFTALDAKRTEAVHAWPVLLPDRAGILYLSTTLPTESNRIVHVPLSGGKTTEVLEADALGGYSAPFLLFVRNGDLYAVRFDPKGVKISGDPRRVVEQVAYSASDGTAGVIVNAAGLLLYPSRSMDKRRLVWYDRAGKHQGIAVEDENISNPRLSPDGKRLLVSKFFYESGNNAVYRVDLERGMRTILTPRPHFGFNALWLPDGERFVYTGAMKTSDFDLFIQADDPQSQPEPLWESRSDDKEAIGLAPDGRHVLAREFVTKTMYDIVLVPLDGKSQRRYLLQTRANEMWASISPDGRWLAYQSDVTGAHEVFVRAMDGGRSIQVSTKGGSGPRWSRDGGEIFFLSPERVLMSSRVTSRGTAIDTGAPVALFKFQPQAFSRWELSPDGTRFLVNEAADASTAVRPINVLFGWKDTLEKP